MDTTSRITLLALAIVVIASALYLFAFPAISRARLDRQTFPQNWQRILRQNMPIYKQLNVTEQTQLQQLIKRFLASKRFVGCAGQQVDDEVRVTIAGQACLLLLNRPSYEYGDLHHILVYPSAFHVQREQRSEDGLVVNHRDDILLGESWSNGRVVLAWDSVIRGVTDFCDGHNVVLHEFAHQLDQESGAVNGLPVLARRSAYHTWAESFSQEFIELQRSQASRQGRSAAVIDDYGATNAGEFFAVCTEAFFERPWRMQHQHPELFEQLQQYYCVDPRNWQSNAE